MENSVLEIPTEAEIQLNISPKNIKRLEDPFKASRYIYEALVPINEAAKLNIGTANPRLQNVKSTISREIRESLSGASGSFHLRNRGIWVVAESAEYDNQTGELVLSCPTNDSKRYGALDGGHTLRIIKEFLAERPESEVGKHKMPYVMLHIRVGIEDEIAELAATLNRSVQLKEYTLANYKGEFDELEELLRREPFGTQIDFKENGNGEYDVVEMLQRLALFCIGIFPGKYNKHPVEAYRSKARCLDYFLQNKKEFLFLKPIMADCLRLPEQIEKMLPEISGSERFGRYSFATVLKKPAISPLLEEAPLRKGIVSWERKYDVATGVTFTLAASLRVLINRRKDGTITGWRRDPVEFFLHHGGALFRLISERPDKSPTVLGKDTGLWADLYHLAYECLHPNE